MTLNSSVLRPSDLLQVVVVQTVLYVINVPPPWSHHTFWNQIVDDEKNHSIRLQQGGFLVMIYTHNSKFGG